jgi:RNA polymerase sigma factor (TIGR02999 family)
LSEEKLENAPGDITLLLAELRAGNRSAESRLLPLVYDELRRQARRYMRGERPDHTLQPTALVHEAYLRLAGQREVAWQSRAHFFAVAAQLMRRILVDHARARKAEKRGGHEPRIALEEGLGITQEKSAELLALDEALCHLAERDPRLARAVELRFFGGLSEKEAAEVLGISTRTLKRDWSFAQTWLYKEINPGAGRKERARLRREAP